MKRRLGRGSNVRMDTDVFTATRPKRPGRVSPATSEEQRQADVQGIALGALMVEWADGERSWHAATELFMEDG